MVVNQPDILAIFAECVARNSDDERSRYLDEACQGDSRMRGRVEALLRAHVGAGNFLGGATPAATPTLDLAPNEKLGTYIDRYKLVHEIGRGGMGVVYMAVQKEPVRRKVALKIIKPGMDTREVVARFETERQALALMDHQSIAHVLDGGSTPSGRPYFVMELVDGTPITEYCDACRFTTRQRLELFIQICQAVQHAHLKGVIHRDIKPSNILVTHYDGAPVPKVIDFGIAKAVHQPLTDASVYTNIQQMVGTPLYMSPEQAERTGEDVDTRTDVYSLGVLLYKLLTGTTPFDKERLKNSGLDEMKRIIREEEPPKPSTRLSTLGAAVDTDIEKQHHTEWRALMHELTGELDWIVMKALEKDRARRYESASDFAKDIQRYLDDEPVQACPPSTAYRLGKFYRRNKAAFTLVTSLALTLLIGAALATGQAVRATKAEGEATRQQGLAEERLTQTVEQRQRAEANLTLAMQALDEVYLKAIGEEKLLREKPSSFEGEIGSQNSPELSDLERELLRRGLSFYDEFARQNQNDPRALFETGKAFYRVALLQTGLEENEEAEEAYTESIARLRRLAEEHPGKAKYWLELGKAYYGQAQLSRWWPSATNTFEEAKATFSRVIELEPGNIEAYELRSKVHNCLAEYEAALSDYKMVVQLEPESAWYQYELAMLLTMVQDPKLRDHNAALEHAKEAVRLAPENHEYRFRLGYIFSRVGDRESAIIEMEKGIALASSPVSQYCYRAQLYSELLHDPQKTIENATKFLEVHEQPWMIIKRAKAYKTLGELDKALADFKRVEQLEPNNWSVYGSRGDIYSRQGAKTQIIWDAGPHRYLRFRSTPAVIL